MCASIAAAHPSHAKERVYNLRIPMHLCIPIAAVLFTCSRCCVCIVHFFLLASFSITSIWQRTLKTFMLFFLCLCIALGTLCLKKVEFFMISSAKKVHRIRITHMRWAVNQLSELKFNRFHSISVNYIFTFQVLII